MGLIKIFSGEESIAISLKNQLENASISVVIRDNNQANISMNQKSKAAELFIQETDYGKSNPIIESFRMNL